MSKAHQKPHSYILQVERTDGRQLTFRLPMDLHQAMNKYRKTHQDDWQNLLKDALIVIPLAPYWTPAPPLGLGKITGIGYGAHRPPLVTRSQFLTAARWPNAAFKPLYRFVRHDHGFWSRLTIYNDLRLWRAHRALPFLKLATRWRLAWYYWRYQNRGSKRE